MAEFSPGRIARWLKAYRDWRAEIEWMGGSPSVSGNFGPGHIPGGSTNHTGGPTAREAEITIENRRRVAKVDHWLSLLTPLERIAAEWWLADGDMTVNQVAERIGVSYRRARQLVNCIPLIIWGHLYDPPLTDNAVSS